MPDAESKEDFLMFRETLAELEFLVNIRRKGKLSDTAGPRRAIQDGIVHMLELLAASDTNTSEANAIEELERLAELGFARELYAGLRWEDLIDRDSGRPILNKMIDSKVNFIMNGSFGRGNVVGPMAALERLAVVRSKVNSKYLDDLLEAKIREFAWRPRAKRSVQPDTTSGHKIATASGRVSETQGNSEQDLTNQCEGSNTIADPTSSPLSLLQNQDSIRAEEDDGSTIDGGELTPTSTITSEFPDPNGG